jgi:hypothetical protein
MAFTELGQYILCGFNLPWDRIADYAAEMLIEYNNGQKWDMHA